MSKRECATSCSFYTACHERAADTEAIAALIECAVPEPTEDLREFAGKNSQLQADRLEASISACPRPTLSALAISKIRSKIFGSDWALPDALACQNPAKSSSEFVETEAALTAKGLAAEDRGLREEAGLPPVRYFTDALESPKLTLPDWAIIGAGTVAAVASTILIVTMNQNIPSS